MATVSRVNTFKTALAVAFMGLPEKFIAIGRGDEEWGESQTKTLTFSSNTLSVSDTNITGVVVKNTAETVTYVNTTDYTVDELTGVVTRVVSGAIPNNATVKVTYAVSLNVLLTEDDMTDEIGRKRVAAAEYVVPDELGEILTSDGKWTISEEPTPHVLLQVTFLTEEGEDETIREFGIFTNVTLDESVMEGTNYVEPEDVADGGYMCVKRKLNPIVKNDVGELSQNYVINF